MEVLASRVIVHSPDLDGLRAFYEATLGLRVFREYGMAGRVSGVVLFLGGGFLELASGEAASPPVTLWLQVPDLGAEERRLQAAGVRVVKPGQRMPWGLLECWVEDPAGNGLRLVEVPADHPLRRRV